MPRKVTQPLHPEPPATSPADPAEAPPADLAEVKAPVPAPEAVAPALEAVLFSLDKPAPLARLAQALALPDDARALGVLRDAVDLLNASYEATGRSFRIERLAGGFRVMTLPAFAGHVAAFHEARKDARLSRAAVETLAVIAYRQPIARVEIEAIRGVACGEVLRTLLERRLVAIVGRAEEVGRPMLYGVSRQFLERFGLASVKDLPAVGEFAARREPDADAAPAPAPEALFPTTEESA